MNYRPRFYRLATMLVFGAMLAFALGTMPAHAASLTVTTNVPDINADGQCSLIEAIVNANDDAATYADCAAGSGIDTITLTAGTYTLTTINSTTAQGDNGLPAITSAIVIAGNGATIVRDGGAPNFRPLQVEASGNLTLNQTTVSRGNPTFPSTIGGAILNNGGTLTLNNSTLSGNTANGGGIYNSFGTVTVSNSTLSGNNANSAGGGIANDGGTVTVSNSTLSGNSANGGGGGILNADGGTLTVSNSTISGNTAPFTFGGAILNSNSTTTLVRSLIAGNSASFQGQEIQSFGGTVTGNNFNLFGHSGWTNTKAFNGFTPSGSDITATSDGTHPTALGAILNPLANNGGPTLTYALVTGSPAVDAVSTGPATDQRGVSRPQGPAFDIGAFEGNQTAANTAPVANNDAYSTNEDTAITVPAPGVLGNDTDAEHTALTAVLVSGSAHGTLTLNPDGSFTYTPAANFNGSDSFTYQATDGQANSTVATVSLTIVSAANQIGQLKAQVQTLITSGALPSSNGQALINKLDSAQKQLDKGNINATITKLQDVITQVNGYIGSGMLTAANGQPLIDAANAIIHSLQV